MYARYIPPPKASSKPKPQAPSPPPLEIASPAASSAVPYSRYVPPPRKQSSATAISAPMAERSIPTSRTHLNAAAIPPPEALPPKIVFNYDDNDDEPSPPKKRKIDSPEPVTETLPEPEMKKPKKEKKDKKEKKKHKDKKLEDAEEDVDKKSDKKERRMKQRNEQPFSFGFDDNTAAPNDNHNELPASVEEQDAKPKDKKKKKHKREAEVDDEEPQTETADNKTEATDSKKKKKTKRGDDEIAAGHKAVLERASKELKKAAEQPKTEDLSDDEGMEAVEAHGLEPLPQPKPVKQDAIKPSYETLPPWIANPIQVAPTATSPFTDLGIAEDAATKLEAKGFKEAFAVQTAVIPLLLPSADRQGDVVVSAATGSGKTLAYALPMVRDISLSSNITRLRGLIVVPTRELVMQAEEVCNACSAIFGRGKNSVKVGISMGNKQFEQEQDDLVEEDQRYDPEGYQKYLARKFDENSWLEDLTNPRGPPKEPLPYHVIDYASKVDILICTPGRLVDHIKRTPGFTLDYVRWLVVDEADKLLAQTYQDWIPTVMPLLSTTDIPGAREFADSNKRGVRKVVLSATMTRDLTLLNGLKLYRPKLVVLSDNIAHSEVEHVLPSQLEENAVKTRNIDLKPLYLVDLLNSEHMAPVSESDSDDVEMKDAESESGTSDSDSDDSSSNGTDSDSEESDADSTASPYLGRATSSKPPPKPFNTTVLIFANSNEAAVRLARLLSLLSPHLSKLIGTLTSTTRTSERRKTLHAFAARKLRILVASSLIERGIHLASLDHVISYDMPKSVQSYVHRVGRTARAGRKGHAWTLFTKPEAGWFWTAIAGKGESKAGTAQGEIRRSKGVGEVRISDRWDEDRLEEFNTALEKLSELRQSSRKGSKLQH